MHPYNASPAEGLRDAGAADGVSIAGFPSFVKLVDKLWPRRKLHFWLTEYGWQTEAPPTGVTEARQAALLAGAVARFSRMARVDALVNYLILDEAATRANAWQSGLRRLDGIGEAGLRQLAVGRGRGRPRPPSVTPAAAVGASALDAADSIRAPSKSGRRTHLRATRRSRVYASSSATAVRCRRSTPRWRTSCCASRTRSRS